MTFDIPSDQPLDVRSHGYINHMRENPYGNLKKSPTGLQNKVWFEYGSLLGNLVYI